MGVTKTESRKKQDILKSFLSSNPEAKHYQIVEETGLSGGFVSKYRKKFLRELREGKALTVQGFSTDRTKEKTGESVDKGSSVEQYSTDQLSKQKEE